MRTTLSIDDHLLAEAKAAARQCGSSLGQFVEQALRRELHTPAATSGPALPTFSSGTGPRPEVDLRSNRALAEFLDEAGS